MLNNSGTNETLMTDQTQASINDNNQYAKTLYQNQMVQPQGQMMQPQGQMLYPQPYLQGQPQQYLQYPQVQIPHPQTHPQNFFIMRPGIIPSQPSDWNNHLCGCMSDLGSCLVACLCPCIQYGQNVAVLSNASCFCNCLCYSIMQLCWLQWCLGCSTRGQIRAKYNIIGGQCGDCCVHLLCPCCALSQESRELMSRGQTPLNL